MKSTNEVLALPSRSGRRGGDRLRFCVLLLVLVVRMERGGRSPLDRLEEEQEADGLVLDAVHHVLEEA